MKLTTRIEFETRPAGMLWIVRATVWFNGSFVKRDEYDVHEPAMVPALIAEIEETTNRGYVTARQWSEAVLERIAP